MSHSDPPRDPCSAPDVPPALQRQIDENLKRLYRETIEEDLPEPLKRLVERLRAEQGGGQAGPAGEAGHR
jgi:hypothetical protein